MHKGYILVFVNVLILNENGSYASRNVLVINYIMSILMIVVLFVLLSYQISV